MRIVLCIQLLFALVSTKALSYEIIAFHGLNQSVRDDAHPGLNDCTAGMINQEDHSFIENTIPSTRAALDLGATMGHFNIHRTADGKIVVFHDYTLECRTNGHGVTNAQTLEYLKQLDVGYGYTFDGGRSYPFRGKGIGLMATIQEFLHAFPSTPFVINEKDNDPETIHALASALAEFDHPVLERLYYFGEQTELVRELLPSMKIVGSKASMKSCFTWWLATGWAGHVPNSCVGTTVMIPVSEALKHTYLISRFLRFLKTVDSKVWMFDANSEDDARFAKSMHPDAIGTYRIDKVIDVLKSN